MEFTKLGTPLRKMLRSICIALLLAGTDAFGKKKTGKEGAASLRDELDMEAETMKMNQEAYGAAGARDYEMAKLMKDPDNVRQVQQMMSDPAFQAQARKMMANMPDMAKMMQDPAIQAKMQAAMQDPAMMAKAQAMAQAMAGAGGAGGGNAQAAELARLRAENAAMRSRMGA